MTTVNTLDNGVGIQPNESSSDWGHHEEYDSDEVARAEMLRIATFVGSAISIVGVLLTMVSYIAYRKFHIQRPHIIIVNLCVCLIFYYFAYLISNNHRQEAHTSEDHHSHHTLCLFGAIVTHFATLATWMWITVYWLMILIMYRRPMGGHVSHFFIKAGAPAYGVPVLITAICGIIANTNGDVAISNERDDHFQESGGYYSSQCFVTSLYLYLGLVLPFCLLMIPMLVIFVVILRGICVADDSSKSSRSKRKVKQHFIRLSIITILFAIVVFSSLFIPSVRQQTNTSFGAVILFSVVSSLLGFSLMVLFCFHQKEIRTHWVSIIRGGNQATMRNSMKGGATEANVSTSRKSSTLLANHPSVYIEHYDDERKGSTCRIVAKEDTDMSTLGLIQIPGTPSPNKAHDTNGENSSSKDNKLSPKHAGDEVLKSPKSPKEYDELKDKHDSGNWSKSRKKHKGSQSTPPVSPREKSAKRQQSTGDMLRNSSDRKKAKRSNSASRIVARFTRKSTSSVLEDTAQLTEFA